MKKKQAYVQKLQSPCRAAQASPETAAHPYPWVPCLKIKSNGQCLKHSCAQCIRSFRPLSKPFLTQNTLTPAPTLYLSLTYALSLSPVQVETLSRCDQGQGHLEEHLENAEKGRPSLQTSGYTPTSTSWGYSEYINDHAGQGHNLSSAERGSCNVGSDMGWGLFPVVYKFHIVCLFQYVMCIHNVGEGKTLLISHHLSQ